ncbi:hypothetical protein BJY04DRAFT_35442 [Aspergillus karnatakaensis]|uniref:uncharacterized protein n=1 Tax=Aspergillus karnatakaensis TaxID=1810916 RepID=UPI003CCE0D4D
MSLSVQGFGNRVSPLMDMRDPSFDVAVPFRSAKPINLEAEYALGRLEPLHSSPMDQSSPEVQNNDSRPSKPVLSAHPHEVRLLDWFPRYKACMEHFVGRAQYSNAVQSLAAYINIRLPCQQSSNSPAGQGSCHVSLRHYIRRLIVTGYDRPSIFQEFFGSDWAGGIGDIWQQERLNYLFTAKSNGWAATKAAYDILPDEHLPFMHPLHDATEEELSTAEKGWSEWLAMEDWMVGSRSPWEPE